MENAVPNSLGRILVIDDEPLMAGIIEKYLRLERYDVVACGQASDAAALAQAADLILCDMHLWGVNGVDLIRDLRAAGVQAPVIMISGDRTPLAADQCAEVGIVDSLPKPFTGAILLEKVQKQCRAAGIQV
jgi:DNA-binding response OmpR family regulator